MDITSTLNALIITPENLKRRDRVVEVVSDIRAFAEQFDGLVKDRAAVVVRLKPKLSQLLDHHGLSDPEELSRRIKAGIDSDVEGTKKYNDLKKRIDSSDEIDTVIMGLVGVVAAVSGVVVGGRFPAGVASSGAKLPAGSDIGVVTSGSSPSKKAIEERDTLRKSIVEVTGKRLDVRIALGQMQAIVDWAKQVEIWMDAMDATNHNTLDMLLSQTLQQEYQKWTREFAEEYLAAKDAARNSYHEDY